MDKDNFQAGITNIMVAVIVVTIIAVFVGVALYYQTTNTRVSSNPTSTIVAPRRTSDSPSTMISMVAQNNSGLNAEYQLIAVGSPSGISTQTRVTLTVDNALQRVLMPAHIHSGTCANLGAIKYSLFNVVDGLSATTIDASILQLKLNLPLAINIHKSAAESGVYVACADLNADGSLDALYNSK